MASSPSFYPVATCTTNCLHQWLNISPHCPIHCEGKEQKIVYDPAQQSYSLAAAEPKPDSQDTAETSVELSSNLLHRADQGAEVEPHAPMDLDEDLERGMEKSDREKEEGAAPEIKVKDQAQPVPIELPPRRKVGDAVIAHYGEATIIAIHPNGNVDVKMDSGDVLLNVLSYCVWTEAENSKGLESFDTFKKATRRGKPREEGKRKQDHTDLNKKPRIVLEGKMNLFRR